MIKLKRAYDPPARGDGCRFLVERLWPRGVRKEEAALDGRPGPPRSYRDRAGAILPPRTSGRIS